MWADSNVRVRFFIIFLQFLRKTIDKNVKYNYYIIVDGVSPSGKALDFDSSMRWFESSYPSQTKY